MRSVQYLTLDINKKAQQTITANVGEVGSRFVKIQIVDDDKPINLTGVDVYLYALKSDNTKLFNLVEVEDDIDGVVLAELTSQLLAQQGNVKLTLVLIEGNNKLSSKEFILHVENSIFNDDVIESTNEFGALTTSLVKVEEWNGYFEETSGQIEQRYTTRLNVLDEQFNTIENEKATKQELDVQKSRIDSFTSLTEGSTTGDAELIDGRTTIFGNTSTNIGEAIREQANTLLDSITKLNDGKVRKLYLNESDLELGNINYSTGALESSTTVKRSKNFINMTVGEELTVNVKNGNGVNLIFYDENENWKVSRAVSATESSNTRTLKVEYPKMKIAYTWFSSSYPISASNCELWVESKTQQNIDNIWEYLQMGKKAESHDFNELTDGTYWLSVSSSENDLLNAPDGLTYGNFSVISYPMTNNSYLQFAYTSINNLNRKAGYFRLFNTSGTNAIKWSNLNVMFHKSQDNYVAFGDSITHGYQKTVNGVDTISTYQYWKTVGNILKLNAKEGANTGSGFVKVQGNKNALRIIDEYDFTDVNLVTLAFGTNDWNGNIPLGTINDKAVNGNVNSGGTYSNDTNTIYSAIKYCVEKILSVDSKITLILITPINRSQVGSSGATLTKENNWGYGARNTAGYTLSDVCQAIVDVAKYYGIPYIDNREGNPINRLTVESLTVDGLHPTDWGYMKLGQYYAAKIGSIYRPYEI